MRTVILRLERHPIYHNPSVTPAYKQTTVKVEIDDTAGVAVIKSNKTKKFFSYNGKTIENKKMKYVILEEI